MRELPSSLQAGSDRGPIGAAEIGLAALAVEAVAAGRRPSQGDVIAGFDGSDIGADSLDDASAFVPADDRHGLGRSANCNAPIAATYAASRDLHQDFARFWRVERYVFNAEARVGLGQDGGLHLHLHLAR